jgi:hypothetical protein
MFAACFGLCGSKAKLVNQGEDMKNLNVRRAVLLSSFAALALLSAGGTSAAPPPAQGVRISAIGNPIWAPVDFHLFSAPIGTAASGYAEFADTALALLPEPNHTFNPVVLVGPGAPHAPPYDHEVREGVAALGFHEGVQFRTSEFSAGAGIYLVFMVVPAPGVVGSSPDFGSGPIIPNALFPIHTIGTNAHNNKPFSFLGEASVPPIGAVDPAFAGLDGHSHFPEFWADNADFGPAGAKLNGTFRFSITMLDATNNGWTIEAHFTLGP